jgi:hypothetical protein
MALSLIEEYFIRCPEVKAFSFLVSEAPLQ